MNNTVILLSTSRTNGNTQQLVDHTAQQADIDVINLNDYSISPFDYEHKNIGDDFIILVKKLIKYDHIIFASPVYWYSMTAQMKVFFDRISDLLHVKKELGRQLREKDTSIISTGASPKPERSFEETFINSFNYLGMNYKGMLYCYCENSFDNHKHNNAIDKYLKESFT